MRSPGRSERRLAAIFFFAVLLPLVASGALAFQTVKAVTWLYTNADTVGELERSLEVYADLARAMKEGLRAKADAIAAQEPLRAAAILRHRPSVEQELAKAFAMYPDLVSLTITAPGEPTDRDEQRSEIDDEPGERPGGDGGVAGADESDREQRLGYVDRGKPLDESLERRLEVRRALAEREGAPEVIAVFAAPRARLDDIERVAGLVKTYKALQQGAADTPRLYFLRPYAMLLGLTGALAVAIGLLVARQVTGRIDTLALAARSVGQGDLTVRVAERGSDEITELTRAFNTMVIEVESSRARIEFLRRMGAWQEMARRLAHEIKNPLTPIQLAVQECHRRYDGDSVAFRRLLDTTVEIVEEEVATLRRLVGEFSSFARMPRAVLVVGDLAEFLREQRGRLGSLQEAAGGGALGVSVGWVVPDEAVRVAFDAQLLHRVMANVIGNAAEAIGGARGEGARGRVEVVLRRRDGRAEIEVDDDGPGVPIEARDRVFDPYFTTRSEGTGLGLAIVKKIVVEHGGTIAVGVGALGGARVTIALPLAGTAASEVAIASGERGEGASSES